MRLRGPAAARERGLNDTVVLATAVLAASQAIDAAVVPKRFAHRLARTVKAHGCVAHGNPEAIGQELHGLLIQVCPTDHVSILGPDLREHGEATAADAGWFSDLALEGQLCMEVPFAPEPAMLVAQGISKDAPKPRLELRLFVEIVEMPSRPHPRELEDVLGVGVNGEATPKEGQVRGATAREHEPRIAHARFTTGIHEHAQADPLAA